MKYFTPELYAQGNSPDDAVVDQSEEEWERRIKRYRRHYKRIEAQLPPALARWIASALKRLEQGEQLIELRA